MKMNGRFILGIQLVSSIFFMSCNKLSEEGTGDGRADVTDVPLQVNMALSASKVDTKGIFGEVGTEAGKIGSVGVLVVKGTSGSYASYTATESDTYSVFEYKAAQSSGSNPTWEPKDSKNIILNNVDGTVFAWAPLGSGNLGDAPTIGGSALTVSGVKVSKSQTFDAKTNRSDCSQIDYLYGLSGDATSSGHQTVNKTNATAELYMHHALAKVSFKVMKKDGDPIPGVNDYVKKIVLTSANTKFIAKDNGMTMSLVDGTLSDGIEVNELSFTATTGNAAQAAAYASNYTTVTAQVYGLVAPVAETTNDLSIALTLGSNNTQTANDRTYSTGTQSKTTLKWEKGKEYIYTIQVSDKSLVVTSVTIVDFAPQTEVALPVE